MNSDKKASYMYTGAFLIPAGVFLLVLLIKGFMPFGDKSLLIMDMSDQFVEFLSALKHGDLFFSWSKAMGTNYIGVFAFIVSSPFSLLTLLFPNAHMPAAILLLAILKISCSGLTCAVFLSRRFHSNSPGILIFSTSYAMMSYTIAYGMNIMWLDSIIWLPVILLGIESILEKDRWGIFGFGIFVCLISNYYTAYMVILFSVLYFLARCLEEALTGKIFCAKALRFTIGGLSAAGLGACFLIPVFLSHFDGKLSQLQMDYDSFLTFSLPQFFSKLLTGSYDSVTNTAAPFVSCGFIVLLFAVTFFWNGKVSRRSKLIHGSLIAFLFLSMWISVIDKVWHAFLYPNWFPYRYSFLFSFLLIYTACRDYLNTGLPRKKMITSLLLAAAVVNLTLSSADIMDGLDHEFGFKSNSSYQNFHQMKSSLLSTVDDDPSLFYRIGSNTDRSKNDALGFGYKGITHYSSSYSYAVNQWLKQFGLAQNYFWSSYYGSTMATDTFLAVKYIVSNFPPPEEYELIARVQNTGIYYNPYVHSGAFFVPLQPDLPSFTDNVFENQNNLFRWITDSGEVIFKEVKSELVSGLDTVTITAEAADDPLYAHFKRQDKPADLYINDEYTTTLFHNETDSIQYIGDFAAGDRVTLYLKSDRSEPEYELYSLDMARFAEAAAQLQAASVQVTEVKPSGYFSGHAVCPENGYVLASIPASAGWKAYVDGFETGYKTLYNTFILIPVTAGSHDITLAYTPPGLFIGMIISAVTGILLAWKKWIPALIANRDKLKTYTNPVYVKNYVCDIISTLCRIHRNVISVFVFCTTPVIAFAIVERLNHNNIFTSFKPAQIWLNLIWYCLLILALYLVMKRVCRASAAGLVLFWLIGMTNHYVFRFRGRSLFPGDLLSVGTAAKVAGNYNYAFDSVQIRVTVIAVVYLILLYILGRQENKRTRSWRFSAPAAGIIVLFLFLFFRTDMAAEFNIQPKMWTTRENGLLLNFNLSLKNMKMDKPEGYSVQALQDLTIQLSDADNDNRNREKPVNIIAIMNEAFSDFSVYPNVETNRDAMPFIRSLSENTISGYTYSSVFGGTTANAEYEFLTGNSIAFTPPGAVAYHMYVTPDDPSLISQLKSCGYDTLAIHPYIASAWNRRTVYKDFGFNRAFFQNDFTDRGYARGFITDLSNYENLIRLYEEKQPGDPFFLFNITMQNHSPYTLPWDDAEQAVWLTGEMEGRYPAVDQYLSLIYKSDEALEYLIDYFSQVDEPTMIVFFGDHQPQLPYSFYQEAAENPQTTQAQQLRQKIPFFIWANYDIPEADGVETSMNYLSSLLIQTANLPLTGYQKLLLQTSEVLPVINTVGLQDSEGKWYSFDEELPEEASELLRLYRGAEYNSIFDKRNRCDDFFFIRDQASK